MDYGALEKVKLDSEIEEARVKVKKPRARYKKFEPKFTLYNVWNGVWRPSYMIYSLRGTVDKDGDVSWKIVNKKWWTNTPLMVHILFMIGVVIPLGLLQIFITVPRNLFQTKVSKKTKDDRWLSYHFSIWRGD